MDSPSKIQNVSDTALWVAVYRALETERPDAAFRDSLAARLAGERGRRIEANMPDRKIVSWALVSRTAAIDRMILSLLPEGIDTVVNLGAGLDTRPYRLDLPAGLRWIEADFPHMIRYKEEKLTGEKPRCLLERRAIDLGDRAANQKFLQEINAGSKKVLVLTEGVLPYLTNEQGSALAEDLLAQPHFLYWIHEFYAPFVIKRQLSRPRPGMENAPMRFNPGEWFSFFEKRGWVVKEKIYNADESRRLGRPLPFPGWWKVLFWLLPEARRRARESTGCVVMQRK